MSFLDPIKPYLALIKLAAFVLLILAAYLYGLADGKEAGKDLVSRAELEQAKAETKTAQDNQKLAEEARDRALARAESYNAVADGYLGKLNDANDKADRLASDLRVGDQRFRKLWAQCQAVPASGEVPASPGAVDAGADDRAASAAAIVRAAAQCDAQVMALQDILRQERADAP